MSPPFLQNGRVRVFPAQFLIFQFNPPPFSFVSPFPFSFGPDWSLPFFFRRIFFSRCCVARCAKACLSDEEREEVERGVEGWRRIRELWMFVSRRLRCECLGVKLPQSSGCPLDNRVYHTLEAAMSAIDSGAESHEDLAFPPIEERYRLLSL